MSKLPSHTPKTIIRILEKNGFTLFRIKGSHHIFFNPDNKRKVIVPFHKKDLPRGTLFEIVKQAGLKKSDLTG